jgi:hypothetical protein
LTQFITWEIKYSFFKFILYLKGFRYFFTFNTTLNILWWSIHTFRSKNNLKFKTNKKLLKRKLTTAAWNKSVQFVLFANLNAHCISLYVFTTPGHIDCVRLQSPTNGRPLRPTFSVLFGSSYLRSLCGSKWLNPFLFKR